jgi:NhaP-type Na+/H+ or K+/H+ antiporter
MQIFLTIAVILGLTALFSYIFLPIALDTQQPTATDALVMFLRAVLGGVGLGVAAAALKHHMMIKTSDYGAHVLISLALVSLGYGLAAVSIVIQGSTISRFFDAERLKRLLAQ